MASKSNQIISKAFKSDTKIRRKIKENDKMKNLTLNLLKHTGSINAE